MSYHSQRFAAAGAGLFMLCSLGPASAADFATVVRSILDSQTDGPLAEMDSDKRSRMTDCVVETLLSKVPAGRQRHIVGGADFDEQEHRFGQLMDENHAKLRGTLAQTCGNIAMDDS